MESNVAGFDWDEANREKCQKLGVSIAEIEGLFTHPHSISVDVEHSLAEERLRTIGKVHTGRFVFLVFTLRERDGKTYMRPISARYLHRKESSTMKKKFPTFHSDEEAERFVEMADLSEYDLSHFRPVRFEFEPKAAQINMRVPKPLLDAVKDRARRRGIPYTRFIRELMEREVSRPDKLGR